MQLDLIRKSFEELREAITNESYEEELKELADLVYVCFQYAENMEWDLEEALIVSINQTCLSLAWTVLLSAAADGKVLKGPNYAPPNLKDLING